MTDEIRLKIEGSQKVAKKLERIDKKNTDSGGAPLSVQSNDTNNNSSSDDESDRNSDIESDVEDSMKSSEMNNYNRNHVLSPSDSLVSNKSCCNCICHSNGSSQINGKQPVKDNSNRGPVCEASAQTLSTGDIVITKVYFPENQQ